MVMIIKLNKKLGVIFFLASTPLSLTMVNKTF